MSVPISPGTVKLCEGTLTALVPTAHGPGTCSALDDDDELDAVRLVERPAALLVVVRVPEVPARRVQQPEVVSEVSTITFLSGFSYGNFSF